MPAKGNITVPKVECQCARCGKTYFVWPSVLAAGRMKYCSRACADAAKRKPDGERFKTTVAFTCAHCGSTFSRVPSSHAKYCSRKCSRAAQVGERAPRWRNGHPLPHTWTRVDRICEHCGKTFLVKASAVRYSGARYCSRKCQNAARTTSDGVQRKKLHWQTEYPHWRKAVFKRDNHTCQRCGKHGGKLNSHHLKSWKDHPDLRYEVSNGQTLCEPCHRAVHRGE